MHSTNIVISLDTRRKKADGAYPLIMRLGHNERTTSIPLNINLLEKDWDNTNKTIRKSCNAVNSVTRLNNFIQKKKAEAMDIIIKLKETGTLETMSVTEIRNKITREHQTLPFFEYTEELIADLIQANRIGTARSYKGVISVLKRFSGRKNLHFRDINYRFLIQFEIDHKSKENGTNGLAVYMRTIRAIFNKAIKAGLVERELYPFDDYKIKTTPTEKRALDWEFIKKIIELELYPGDKCFNARNYFLASYMMYGMNFKDMAYLKKADIVNGRIVYRRKKTGKIYDIKVTTNLNDIFSHYIRRNPDSEYIFSILKRDTAILQERDVQWARKRYNKRLKELAKLCGIESNLTSYVSRHSFATQAMLQQVPVNAISTMLGHSSLKTTEIYLKSLPNNILDNYNEAILKGT